MTSFEVQVVDVLLSESHGFVQPGQVRAQPFDLDAGEPFAAVLCRFTEWFQVPGTHE